MISGFLLVPNLALAPPFAGNAGAAEEKRAVNRGSFPETVQQQEHEGDPRAAQQRPGGGHGGPASPSSRGSDQSKSTLDSSKCRIRDRC